MLEIPILYHNEDIIVVNKPEGLSIHNHEDPQNLLTCLEQQFHLSELYPVHRLDKETSGVQILALNAIAAQNFSKEFQQRKVKKIYHGILRGQLSESQGIWSRPLTDKSEGRRNPQGLSNDRVPCETKFQVLEKAQHYFTLCEFDILTGRQHQIRKHTTLANHPLVGDPRYGDPHYNRKIAQLYQSKRMFLHCKRIEIFDLVIESPVPLIFTQLLSLTPL